MLPPVESKERRSSIHMAIRALGGLLSATVTEDSKDVGRKKCNSIVVTRKTRKAKQASNFDLDKRPWPHNRPNYTHFTLKKVNLETTKAIEMLSFNLPRYCRLGVQAFSFAGLKDRRGVTYQRVAAKRAHPSALLEAAEKINSKRTKDDLGFNNIEVGSFSFREKFIYTGELKGNRFVVRITHIKKGEKNVNLENIKLRCERPGNNIFPNYFGSQRFGTSKDEGTRTHEIGLLIAKGDYEDAVKEILKSNRSDALEYIEPALSGLLKTSDIKNKGFSVLPFNILSSLISSASNLSEAKEENKESVRKIAFKKAILSIPRHSRNLYVHALQSYIFNAILESYINDVKDKKRCNLEDDDFIKELKELTFPLVNGSQKLKEEYRKYLNSDLLRQLEIIESLPKEFSEGVTERNAFSVVENFLYKVELDEDSDECSLVASFDLESGSYATVFMRELLGADPLTSPTSKDVLAAEENKD